MSTVDRSFGRSFLWALGCLAIAAISQSSCSGGSSLGTACIVGDSRACQCDGAVGVESCQAQLGRYGACECSGTNYDAFPAVCGDKRCTGGEDCQSCPDDCGECPKCNYAPACSDAVGVPTMISPRPNLNIPMSGAPPGMDMGKDVQNCDTPKLRLRVQKIRTDKGGGIVYCVVNASDGINSGVAITTKSSKLGDGNEYYFDPSVGIFWGSKDLQSSRNNITITYNCFVVKSDAWAKVLMAAGDAANKAGGVAGLYGWAFGLGAVAAQVAGAALQAASGDELHLNGQQTIDKSELLDLTNGRSWTVHGKGSCGVFCTWDWTLTVESWGCANPKPVPQ